VPDEGRLKPWYVLQDDGGDVAALVACAPPPPPPSGGGLSGVAQVAAQWTYDAYGSALTAESLAPHPVIHCGHKGLFLDRLDAGVAAGTAEIPRLVPYAHLVVQMRNRAYSPALGRFYQQDPNATAMAVIGASVYHGQPVQAGPEDLSLASVYRDGPNSYQYLRSATWNRSDPLGLYEDDEGEDEDADDGYTGRDLYEDVSETLGLLSPLPGPGDIIREMFRALTEDYAANLRWDVRWASDWSMPDDDHSRIDDGWVPQALGRGLHDAFEIGLPGTDASVNPLRVLANPYRTPAGTPGPGRPRINAGYTIHVQRGQRAHVNYRNALGPGYRFEVSVPGGRVDAIDVQNRIVRELKPDTPSGRARGAKQLNRYIAALKNHPDPGIRGVYTGHLDTYRP
jgi:hypothetical protein